MAETPWQPDPASFRDTSGRVYLHGERVFRTVGAGRREDYAAFRDSGLLDELVSQNRLVETGETDPAALPGTVPEGGLLLEHARLPFVSYPYEWGFRALKAAALLHLEIHRAALRKNMTLTDASAYNVQFVGARPVFIDALSFKVYENGEYWMGYRQFCEQFLNPLLLRALCGVPHNDWFRGRLEGLPGSDLKRLLPWRARLSPKVLTHVVLQAALEEGGKAGRHVTKAQVEKQPFPRQSLERLLDKLARWIDGLAAKKAGQNYWADYGSFKSYSIDETAAKHVFVADFAKAVRPAMLWDVGCNTGEFANVALSNGAAYAVGWDTDQHAVDTAFETAESADLPFTPLYGDAANPTPSQGWAQAERLGWAERGPANAVLALALVHHLAIGRNVPLANILDWLMALAPSGVVEFAPKSDVQVRRMLDLREDIFDDYDLDHFLSLIGERGRVVRRQTLEPSGRELIHYETKMGR